ncbi:CLUMA_CG019023, isoform A [Clunio marinus]|uniref:CLUMA_CG019023, isoform A n=1 Tax=Clunio marinus TaxID=568069 RepID=A0A1J1J5P2_9DIPT|nr:CLUMA_CG019023, isoform A [Clunio marinus]
MKVLLIGLFFCVLIASIVNGEQLTEKEKKSEKNVIKYLRSFGYLPENNNRTKISHKQLRHSLRQLQVDGHIAVTGKIDDATLKLMKVPRCGFRDIKHRTHKRQKRYDLLSSKWDKRNIGWHFDHKNGKYASEASKIRFIISEALNIWQENSVLIFHEVTERSDADILISFEKIEHYDVDGYPMNDPILAHAFRPGLTIGGDVHFREDLEWDFDVIYGQQATGNRLSFFAVALHELGHTLGLGHSDRHEAVMYEFYTVTTGVLSKDDIEGIHHIYGVPKDYQYPTTSAPTTEIAQPSPTIPDKCDMSYDAIAKIRNELFIFKDIYYWRPDSSPDAIEIRQMWPELPENLTHVDSVFENVDGDGNILFFIGRDIYAFNATKFVYKSTLMHLGIDRHFEKIDAIFKWYYNNRTYMFSGDEYFRLDGRMVSRRYPKDILRSWREVYDIDTAFGDDKKLYFFKGKYFYEFKHGPMRIDRMQPIPSAQNFMQCPGNKRLTKILSRFGDETDVIDDGEVVEIQNDEDNVEKVIETTLTPTTTTVSSEKTTSTSKPDKKDAAIVHHPFIAIMLASLAISWVVPSISLHL